MNDEPQRPKSDDDRQVWTAYWTAQGMAWRSEPEIDEERKGILARRLTIQPDIQKGIYPFKGEKLDRKDVEWLLATHNSGGKVGQGEPGPHQQ